MQLNGRVLDISDGFMEEVAASAYSLSNIAKEMQVLVSKFNVLSKGLKDDRNTLARRFSG